MHIVEGLGCNMGTNYNPNIITSGLTFCVDAGNIKSYPSSGTTWNDLSGNNKHGTLVNGPTFSTTAGGSIVFDGTDDYVSSSFSTTATTNITLQCWVNITDTSKKGAFMRIGSGGDGYAIGVGNNTMDSLGNEIIGLFPNIRWIDTNTNYGTGWKFVTFMLNASSVPSIYVNTTLIGSYSGIAPTAPTPGLYIGRVVGNEEPGIQRAFQGNIATGIVYNRTLSTQEVLQNFNVTRRRFGV